MAEEIKTAKDVRDLRKAFRIQYTKFARDFEELGKRFRQIAIDADLMLAAAEEILRRKKIE